MIFHVFFAFALPALAIWMAAIAIEEWDGDRRASVLFWLGGLGFVASWIAELSSMGQGAFHTTMTGYLWLAMSVFGLVVVAIAGFSVSLFREPDRVGGVLVGALALVIAMLFFGAVMVLTHGDHHVLEVTEWNCTKFHQVRESDGDIKNVCDAFVRK